MDKAVLWVKNMFTRKGTEESKSIMQKNSYAENETSRYASINGADPSEVSCVPCGNHTNRGFVTCPTCQGTGRIPRGRYIFKTCSAEVTWPCWSTFRAKPGPLLFSVLFNQEIH